MPTLIIQRSGGKTRTCSATCHNAKRQLCTCICQGGNHGCGLQQAIQNTREQAQEILARLDGTGRLGALASRLPGV